MRFIDAHCDTFLHLMRNHSIDLKTNTLCVDLEKMKTANSLAQFFAFFISVKEFSGDNPWEESYLYAWNMIRYGKQCIAKYADLIAPAYCYEDVLDNDAKGIMSAVFTVEEGGIIHGKMECLEELYRQGIRLVTLTWNHENCIGFPNSRDKGIMQQGLKPFGIEVVECMNKLGMIIDVSHLSDGGFWDVIKYSKKPIMASHSNARTLCPHPRNLSDEMIKALAENGGICGVNFYPHFLNQTSNANAQDIAEHISYIYQVGGEDSVAIGTDFDGFFECELDVAHVGQMQKVYDAIKKRGFTESQMEKFLYKNTLRVLKEQNRH